MPTGPSPEEPLRGVSPGVADALAQARAFGYLGPGPLQIHVDHAKAFGRTLLSALGRVTAVDEMSSPEPAIDVGPDFDLLAVDLGSGGGVPGLILAESWPASRWVFVDSNQRRMATLIEVISRLGWESRCEVRVGRAEDIARSPSLRGNFGAVVARGFAAPSVTAECAAGFLSVGGVLVVSEPPSGPDRWSDRGLARLGMERRLVAPSSFRFFTASQRTICSTVYPRPTGTPAKLPLF